MHVCVCVFVFVCSCVCVCCVRIVERALERTVQGSSLGTILIYSEAPLHRTPCEWIHPIGIFLLAHTHTHNTLTRRAAQTGCAAAAAPCMKRSASALLDVIGKHITTSWCYEYRQFSFWLSPYCCWCYCSLKVCKRMLSDDLFWRNVWAVCASVPFDDKIIVSSILHLLVLDFAVAFTNV